MLERNIYVRYFLDRFSNRTDAFYVQVPNEKRYQARYETLATGHVIDHLSGRQTLSLPAVSVDGTSKWLAFDADNDIGNLAKINEYLIEQGWHTLRANRREGREGHLIMLLDAPVPSGDVILFGKEVLNRLSVSINGSCGVELFPKQSTSNRLANGLRLPLGINMKPGVWKRSWFEGVEQDVDEQLKWFYAQPVNSGPVVSQISTQVRDRESRIADQTFVPTGMKRATLTKKTEKTDLLEIIPSHQRKRIGSSWLAQCPVCAAEGHDHSCDNLHIDPSDGTLFCCWYGGQPGKIHTAVDIINALSK